MAIEKEKIEAIVKKVANDKKFAAELKTNPAKAIESVIGVDLPDDQVNAVIKAVTAKVGLDSLGSVLDKDGDGKPDLAGLAKLGGSLLGKK